MPEIDPTAVVPFPTGPVTSNREFLELIFGERWREALVTSFARDPADPNAPRQDWNASPAGDVLAEPHFDKGNTYFCPSLLTPGIRDRRLEHWASLHAVVIDDIGTKVKILDVIDLLRSRPTYIIETSPGNYQAGWKIEPETRLAWVKGMLAQLDKALDGKADNLTNPIAWRRLPVGFNTKATLISPDRPRGWEVRLSRRGYPGPMIRGLDWPCEIEARIGDIIPMTTLDRGVGDGQRPDAAVLAQDPVYRALEAAGHILGEKVTSDKFWAVTVQCPWIAGHGPSRPLSGAEYVPAVAGHRGWFHCFHCERRGQAEFREQLDVVLRQEGAKIVAAFEFDELNGLETAGTRLAAAAGPAGAAGTEHLLTQAFVERYKDRLRFDHTTGQWFRWTGDYWRADTMQHAFDRAFDLAREYRGTVVDLTPGQSRATAKVAFAKAMENAARADQQLATDGVSWDIDPYLAGAPGCEIDLRTGALLPPDPSHGITKQLRVTPRDTPTPLWNRLLWDSTGGDMETIEFLQAWCGYCLTGDTSEEKFVFIYGPGGNGKGTFLFTVSAILNDYGARTPADMFMKRKHEAHPEEVARLAGVRFLVATEIAQGHTFNVARLKDFTGRDGKLTGRWMRQNTFEFVPQFKVTIVGNNQPKLVSVDDAMRRRMILVPFTHTPGAVDTSLKDRLVQEYPGILHWMIEGETLRRAKGGLAALIPAAAVSATDEYLEEQDTLKRWASERCVFAAGRQMGVSMALEDYRTWCHSRGENAEITVQDFSRKFVERFPSVRKLRNNQGYALIGASLSTQDVG